MAKKAEPKQTGRRSKYSEQLADEICEAIATTEKGLHTLCQEREHWPSAVTIYAWLKSGEHKTFLNSYVCAREAQAEYMADQLIAIADDGSRDLMTIGSPDNPIEVENREVTNRSKLRVDTRKWLMSKMLPKKYGDKVAVDHTTGGKPILPSWMQENNENPK